jgi:hypothetical protein
MILRVLMLSLIVKTNNKKFPHTTIHKGCNNAYGKEKTLKGENMIN